MKKILSALFLFAFFQNGNAQVFSLTKSVLPVGFVTSMQADNNMPMHYLLNFCSSDSDTLSVVTITDTLPNGFVFSSMMIDSMSSPGTVLYDTINGALSVSFSNFPDSTCGWISFHINLDTSLDAGDTLRNYFEVTADTFPSEVSNTTITPVLHQLNYHHFLASGSNEWDFSLCQAALVTRTSASMFWYASGDTLINSNHYKIANETPPMNALCMPPAILVREDTFTGKVWLIEPGTSIERLLYDFGMNVGDSMPLYFNATCSSLSFYNGQFFTVDSVLFLNTLSGIRRIIWLSINGVAMRWIEGVGCDFSPIYSFEFPGYGFGINCWCSGLCGAAPPVPYPSWMLAINCAFADGNKIYQDSSLLNLWSHCGELFQDSTGCSIVTTCGTSVSNLSKDFELSVSPNIIYVETELRVASTNMLNSISIFDISGKLREQFEFNSRQTQNEITIGDLPAGYYFLRAKSGARFATVPLVVMP